MYTAYCDGGSRGNPGPSAYAAVITDEVGSKSVTTGFLGDETNNVAEYHGLLAVLDWVVEQSVPAVHVYSDSMLLVQQINGKWKVKDPELRRLWENCQLLINRLDSFEITHVMRSKNAEADSWVNHTLDIAENSQWGKGL